ncbi:MAG: type II 3-dehydroquinate dehydratase [Microthrixaceae bacterium]
MKVRETEVLLLSGPNLNLLGEREPEIYGSATLEDLVASARTEAGAHGLTLSHVQSNHEGVLVDAIHDARASSAGMIINAGAFTHYSWAIHDALASFGPPVVELHISNPATRESWRHRSVISPVATAVIAGLGPSGYAVAVRALAQLIAAESTADGPQ